VRDLRAKSVAFVPSDKPAQTAPATEAPIFGLAQKSQMDALFATIGDIGPQLPLRGVFSLGIDPMRRAHLRTISRGDLKIFCAYLRLFLQAK